VKREIVSLDQRKLKKGQAEPAGGEKSPPIPPAKTAQELEKQVVEALQTCYDPEIPVNIHELGLIYKIDVRPGWVVDIKMTLTSPGCPVAGTLPGDVEGKVKAIPGVTAAKVQLVWDPPWKPDMMTEAARLTLGLDL
jgi:FeS assembly SUF system protein